MKIYDVVLSYPIQVTSEDETHVKEIILSNQYLGEIKNLDLQITEAIKEGEWKDTVGLKEEK